jgi:hypothetical protein
MYLIILLSARDDKAWIRIRIETSADPEHCFK